MNFVKFKDAVAKQFKEMGKSQRLFRVAVSGDKLWETYLKSFPEGSNPIYRQRTGHDCSCCKQFIRTVGNVVAIKDNKLISIWDVEIPGEPAYQAVANALCNRVTASYVNDVFFHYENVVGTNKSFEHLVDSVKTWDHFFVNIPIQHFLDKKNIAPKRGEYSALHDVFKRGLIEISLDAVDTVLELIDQNSLYRGEEQKFAVSSFRKMLTSIPVGNAYDLETFYWSKITTEPVSVTKIRNTAIGTMLLDLSNGVDLEKAVKSFESIVAPMNYKRPTALVTKAMVESAKKRIEELGLLSALERRYATLNDITINNILFANRETKKHIEGSVFDDLANKPLDVKKMDKVEEVTIEKFLSDILPKADSVELLIENKHTNHFMSLIAPADASAKNLFKWDNNFSWSYNGNVTDSIKERVKAAGGNVTGEFCCRLAWYNYDDLDFHMVEPDGNEIMFNNKGISRCGGRLDVDMNAGGGHTRTPVENIYYGSMKNMREGIYELKVHNFAKRESNDVGFEVEVDILGDLYSFTYPNAVKDQEYITVATFTYSKKDGLKVTSGLTGKSSSKTIWNISTGDFRKVNVVMMSPNYWDDKGTGNKHYFFMLDGCVNEEGARGFYNEFLKEDLNPHRKVIEMVGAKMKTNPENEQLSGIGFSSTQRNSILCRVKGSFTRTLKINF